MNFSKTRLSSLYNWNVYIMMIRTTTSTYRGLALRPSAKCPLWCVYLHAFYVFPSSWRSNCDPEILRQRACPRIQKQVSGRSGIQIRVCPTLSPVAFLRSCLAEQPSTRGGGRGDALLRPPATPHIPVQHNEVIRALLLTKGARPGLICWTTTTELTKIAARSADVRATSISGVSEGRFRFDKLIKNAMLKTKCQRF